MMHATEEIRRWIDNEKARQFIRRRIMQFMHRRVNRNNDIFVPTLIRYENI
jgi:hypothetical protein